MDLNESTTIDRIYLGLNAAILVVGSLVCLIVVVKLWRRFKEEPLAFAVGLGLAIWALPDGAAALWRALMSHLDALARFPDALAQNWPDLGGTPWAPAEHATTLGGILRSVATVWRQVLDSTFSTGDRAIVFLLVWLIAVLALSRARLASLRASYLALTPTAQKNTLFFLIVGVASYLSIAAIAAIPNFREADIPAEVRPEELQQRLRESMTAEQFDKIFPVDLFKGDPFAQLDALGLPSSIGAVTQPVESPPDGAAYEYILRGEQPASAEQYTRTALAVLSSERLRRAGLVESWHTLRTTYVQSLLRQQNDVARRFQTDNLARFGVRETVQHFQTLDAWYTQQVEQAERQMRDCISNITQLDASWQKLVDFVRGGRLAELYGAFPSYLSEGAGRATWACSTVYTAPTSSPPPRPELGSNLTGPFGFMARWLLRTESIGLVMITGLIGFGLLGAACSTFVREQRRFGGAPSKAIVENLGGVVITGFGAAVVVFLAVEGGLAIFSTGEAEPNPYVLLFTCLVAAVFSEEVWGWAYERLRDGLNGSGSMSRSPSSAIPAEQGQGGVPPI